MKELGTLLEQVFVDKFRAVALMVVLGVILSGITFLGLLRADRWGTEGFSAFGWNVGGKKILGDTVYANELRATGSGGLNLYDDGGSGGLTVNEGGAWTQAMARTT